MSDTSNAPEREWLPPDPAGALSNMHATLQRAGISIPFLPATMLPGLRSHADGWAWTTEPRFDAWHSYLPDGMGDLRPAWDWCLDVDTPDFFFLGHRGHGIGSWGIGLFARLGPLLINERILWGAMRIDGSPPSPFANVEVNAAIEAWNTTAAGLHVTRSQELAAVIRYTTHDQPSLFVKRALVQLATPPDSEDRWREIHPLWTEIQPTQISSIVSPAAPPLVRAGVAAALQHVAIASERLRAIIADIQARVPIETTPTTSSPKLGVDEADDDLEHDEVIGLDELVDAIVSPTFSGPIDHVYYRHLVDLTCVVFGLEGRTKWLEYAMDQISDRVLPFDGFLEVPAEVARAYESMDNRLLVRAVRDGLEAVQRSFFRQLLIEIDPAIETKTTTIARLRSLGLPEERVVTYDDY